MKFRKSTLSFLLILLLLLTGCSGGTDTALQSTSNETEAVDVDLTALSSTMVYSEVYNMLVTPDDYIGKTVKMSGQFMVYQADPEVTDVGYYYTVLISDATSCCAQGMEFVLDGDYSYPEDYPEIGTEVTVTGTFETYEEGDYLYCHLVGCVMA